MCRDISSFMAGSKRPGTEINGIVDASKVGKKKKHMHPFNKTRPKLCTMKHVIPFPHRPNNNTSFPPDASGRRINLHWFTERPWMELCPSTFKVKCWVCRSQFKALHNKNALISKKQDTFATVGYEGNKHVLQKLSDHENCRAHVMCMELHSSHVRNQQSIHAELNRQGITQKERNRNYLLTVVMSLQYSCKQNTPLRGNG